MVMPGDNVNLEVELITPIAIEEGLRFSIREGGHRRIRGCYSYTIVTAKAVTFRKISV